MCYLRIDAADTFSLGILRRVHHPNVLHMEAFISKAKSSAGVDKLEICVEEYTESLQHCLPSLGYVYYEAGAPSKMIKVLIRYCGCFYDNFVGCLHSIFYVY